MCVLHSLGQFACGSARILEHRHVVGFAFGHVGGGIFSDLVQKPIIGDDNAWAFYTMCQIGFFSIGYENRRVAVINAQSERIWTEQCEHWY